VNKARDWNTDCYNQEMISYFSCLGAVYIHKTLEDSPF
jgi:hypothetical protein